mmetsp:Transcript_65367/g.170111  ORF Transcript_65367/g.170111 Transcript_65367/m.170111 type:complete len:141 (+) Transcript_65367:80-502(+)
MGASPPARAVCSCCVQRDQGEYQGPSWIGGGAGARQELASYGSSGRRHSAGSGGGGGCLAASASASDGWGLNTGLCIVCKQSSASTACLPCGHILVCYPCSMRYDMPNGAVHPDTRCPCCKTPVQQFHRVFTQARSREQR